MEISIVIVNYNVKEYIISCVQSIYKHTKSNLKFEIVIVDNNSIDGSVDDLKKKFEKVKIIENKYNAGFSTAVNQGVKKSIGKYIFILNPDVLFIEDTLNIIFQNVKKIKKIGAAGPRIHDGKGNYQRSFWRKPSLSNVLKSMVYLDFLNFKKNYYNIKPSKNFEVETLSGSAFMVRKDIFDEIGGLNQDLFWMEDIDFCVRLKNIGLKNFYIPKTKIIHFGGKSSEKNYNISIPNQILSKVKYFHIHHSNLKANSLYFSILFITILKTIILFFYAKFSKSGKIKLKAYLVALKLVLGFR